MLARTPRGFRFSGRSAIWGLTNAKEHAILTTVQVKGATVEFESRVKEPGGTEYESWWPGTDWIGPAVEMLFFDEPRIDKITISFNSGRKRQIRRRVQ